MDASTDDMSQLQDLTKKISAEEDALSLELNAPSRVRVLDEGLVSRVIDRKRETMAAVGAGISATALVLLAIAWFEFRTRRVTSADDVAHGLGMTLVGALPDSSSPSRLRRLIGVGRSRQSYGQNLLTESVDSARTMLLQAAQSESLKFVMITSA